MEERPIDSAPMPTGRYGLNQNSMLHPFALSNPTSPIFTQPGALSHYSALTGMSDRQLSDFEPQQEEINMGAMDILNQMGKTFAANMAAAPAGISAAMGREALNLRDQVVVLLDTRLQTTATYPRNTPAYERTQEPPTPPPPAPEI